MKNKFEVLPSGKAEVLMIEEMFDHDEFYSRGAKVFKESELLAMFPKKDFEIMQSLDVEFRKITMRKAGAEASYIRHFGYWKEETNGKRRFIKLSEIKRKAASI
ncbi:hypothetical protein CIB87_21360 [Priestia megaterium]|uniref:Uncharacterized protein n=1 Tax=Priestia megaterium TaxID=1404 RepID=A0AA86I741_PRIMG|nr:hypothetical protein [Priestia megaterium]AXI31464.1 hypothetical protein CIB87_21360 [Priestia megaterium]